MKNRRVVVTGLGSFSGLGKNIPEAWQNVLECKSGIAPIQSIDMNQVRFKNGCEVKGYVPVEYFTQKELTSLDKVTQFAILAAREAVKDANVQWTDELRAETCVITGSSIGGQDSQQNAFTELFLNKNNWVDLFTIPKIMPNAGASNITIEFGITGMAYTISTACASSNHAIGNAFWLVRNGAAEMAIAGGSETPLSLGYLKAWEAIRVVAPDTCRPFSKDRQGMILGEGASMLVLEEESLALKRGAKIYCEVVGFGMSSDASHITKPNQKGAEQAMKKALQDADITSSEIDYINAHGTGTLANDAMETMAIKEVFGNHAFNLAISSTKALHGHLLGGTSAIEAAITCLAILHQIFPATANYIGPDPECGLNVIPNACYPGQINYALSNSFAFGGLNAVLAFKKYTERS